MERRVDRKIIESLASLFLLFLLTLLLLILFLFLGSVSGRLRLGFLSLLRLVLSLGILILLLRGS
jgi:hypothetical protein